MPHFICTTCGAQYAESLDPPPSCAICEDPRQYVKKTGQQWTTHEKLKLTNRNSLKAKEPGLIGAIKAMGGISAIAISHPHYYSSMVECSRAYGGIPIYLHAGDRQWVMRPHKAIVFWEGETRKLAEGLTLIRCGGHFEGGTVLHWEGGADGKGALLSGDIIQVVPDRKNVSFMYSYPNYIPLSASAVDRIAKAVEPFPFDRIYGAFWNMAIEKDGKEVVTWSVERYKRAEMVEGDIIEADI